MKLKNRVLIAGLMAIAVTGASTFAYFTSGLTISDGSATNKVALDITNGKVKITGKIGAGEGTPIWTYDVARNSTTNYSELGTSGKTVAGITTTNNKSTDITAYENENRSPDLIGLDTASTNKENVDGLDRWKIGTPVTGAISKARPGDAFVLGQAAAYGTDGTAMDTNTGLTITNDSNLTVKIDMGLSGTATADQTNTFTALKNAGFELYIGTKQSDCEKIDSVSALNTKISTILGTKIAASASKKIYIRIELPLNTVDTYQEKKIKEKEVEPTITSFDITKLFTIKATQENNPGWNANGGTN